MIIDLVVGLPSRTHCELTLLPETESGLHCIVVADLHRDIHDPSVMVLSALFRDINVLGISRGHLHFVTTEININRKGAAESCESFDLMSSYIWHL